MGDIDFFAPTPAPAGASGFVFGAPASTPAPTPAPAGGTTTPSDFDFTTPSAPAPAAGTDDFFATPSAAPSATPATPIPPAPASGTDPFSLTASTTATPAATKANGTAADPFSSTAPTATGGDDLFSSAGLSSGTEASKPVELPSEWDTFSMEAVHTKLRNLVEQNQDTYDDEAEDVYELQKDNVSKTNRLVHVSRNILTNVFHAERTMKDLGDIENSQAEIERKLDTLEALMSPFEDNEQSEISAMRENIFTEARILHQRVYQMSAEIQELGERLKQASSATNHVEGDNGDVVKCLNVNLDVMTHVHSQTRELDAKLNSKRLRHLLTDE